MTSRYYVVGRETLFRPGRAHALPNEERIDDVKLRTIIDDAYKQAGIAAADIDTAW